LGKKYQNSPALPPQETTYLPLDINSVVLLKLYKTVELITRAGTGRSQEPVGTETQGLIDGAHPSILIQTNI